MFFCFLTSDIYLTSEIGQKTVDFELEPNILNTGNHKGVFEAKNPQLKFFKKKRILENIKVLHKNFVYELDFSERKTCLKII